MADPKETPDPAPAPAPVQVPVSESFVRDPSVDPDPERGQGGAFHIDENGVRVRD